MQIFMLNTQWQGGNTIMMLPIQHRDDRNWSMDGKGSCYCRNKTTREVALCDVIADHVNISYNALAVRFRKIAKLGQSYLYLCKDAEEVLAFLAESKAEKSSLKDDFKTAFDAAVKAFAISLEDGGIRRKLVIIKYDNSNLCNNCKSVQVYCNRLASVMEDVTGLHGCDVMEKMEEVMEAL